MKFIIKTDETHFTDWIKEHAFERASQGANKYPIELGHISIGPHFNQLRDSASTIFSISGQQQILTHNGNGSDASPTLDAIYFHIQEFDRDQLQVSASCNIEVAHPYFINLLVAIDTEWPVYFIDFGGD